MQQVRSKMGLHTYCFRSSLVSQFFTSAVKQLASQAVERWSSWAAKEPINQTWRKFKSLTKIAVAKVENIRTDIPSSRNNETIVMHPGWAEPLAERKRSLCLSLFPFLVVKPWAKAREFKFQTLDQPYWARVSLRAKPDEQPVGWLEQRWDGISQLRLVRRRCRRHSCACGCYLRLKCINHGNEWRWEFYCYCELLLELLLLPPLVNLFVCREREIEQISQILDYSTGYLLSEQLVLKMVGENCLLIRVKVRMMMMMISCSGCSCCCCNSFCKRWSIISRGFVALPKSSAWL